ncbi:hypothetical Protein YC6258_03565 [Gynuella sunshinyii YC6258]|uniref:Uncharacterized protein n=1 Tax=Gynuella sunshinyii YC6258 TaxID=1445510 RepID=A0A0C5VMR5_9GAMM|nr:hypothetical Protein YC6258_03565 [Gynuella sunshinyii YC6258]
MNTYEWFRAGISIDWPGVGSAGLKGLRGETERCSGLFSHQCTGIKALAFQWRCVPQAIKELVWVMGCGLWCIYNLRHDIQVIGL